MQIQLPQHALPSFSLPIMLLISLLPDITQHAIFFYRWITNITALLRVRFNRRRTLLSLLASVYCM